MTKLKNMKFRPNIIRVRYNITNGHGIGEVGNKISVLDDHYGEGVPFFYIGIDESGRFVVNNTLDSIVGDNYFGSSIFVSQKFKPAKGKIYNVNSRYIGTNDKGLYAQDLGPENDITDIVDSKIRKYVSKLIKSRDMIREKAEKWQKKKHKRYVQLKKAAYVGNGSMIRNLLEQGEKLGLTDKEINYMSMLYGKQ